MTARSLAITMDEVVALAHEAPRVDAFARELLVRLERALGFDQAFLDVKNVARPPAFHGFDAPRMSALAARGRVYERELADVKRAALAARGVAVDTSVLGERAVRARAYHRELAAPVGGTQSLLAYVRLRGRDVGGLMLGRCGGAFRACEVEALERLIPAFAIAFASFDAAPVACAGALTPRERDVLEYVCLGYTNREIAGACGTSPNTVRNQLARVFAKIGASTRAEAVAIALGRSVAAE